MCSEMRKLAFHNRVAIYTALEKVELCLRQNVFANEHENNSYRYFICWNQPFRVPVNLKISL